MARRQYKPIVPGDVFARLTILAPAESAGHRSQHWRVRCACGAERDVEQRALRSGNTTSCGCAKIEILRARSITHGGTAGGRYRPEYMVWQTMLSRCTNPNSPSFKDYGARGIVVCEAWRDFAVFLSDMGPRPSSRHTIERRDNSGPYAPDNCEWVTWTKQARNRRGNRTITHEGETLCLAEWAERAGLRPHTLRTRIFDLGWAVGRALTERVQPRTTITGKGQP